MNISTIGSFNDIYNSDKPKSTCYSIVNDDVLRAISDMHKDKAIAKYQYFVGDISTLMMTDANSGEFSL